MPEALTKADVTRIAALANLDLTDDETALLGRQLTDILTFAARIAEADTAGVPPAAGALAGPAALRPDEAGVSLPRGEALAGAPEADEAGGFFKVPRVIG